MCNKCGIELNEENRKKPNRNICKNCANKRWRETRRLKKEGLWTGGDYSLVKENNRSRRKTAHKTEDDVEYKLCANCKEWKTLDYYKKNKQSWDGLNQICRQCLLKSIEKIQEKSKNNSPSRAEPYKYIDEIPFKKCTICLEYKNLTSFNKSKTSWDMLTNRCKLCYNIRKKEIRDHRYKNDIKYREKILQKLSENTKRLWKTNVNFRIKMNLYGRIRTALKGKSKNKSTIELLGCTIPEFILYIENLFQPGMSWENYGPNGWHIDHIVPCASFDLSYPEQQKLCFHHSNLQPLFAKDNISKGAKLDWKINNNED